MNKIIINGGECSPLEFFGYSSPKEEFDSSKTSVEEMVLRALILAREYDSYDADGEFETERNRWRSSYDIWRHIKLFYPEVTLAKVMNAIFNIREKLVGHFCSDVERRVFRIRSIEISHGHEYILQDDEIDEYNLLLKDWEYVVDN